MNAAIGSVTDVGVGPLAAEPEDSAGKWLRSIAQEHHMWLPSTFDQVHSGATHTYVQKKSFRLLRPDFVLLPSEWRAGCVQSWSDPHIHAGHVVQDHVASTSRCSRAPRAAY